jgi:hypothetical protein
MFEPNILRNERVFFKVIFHTLGIIFFTAATAVLAKSNQVIDIAYLTQERSVPAALSNLDVFIQNKGMLGAELAISDNNTGCRSWPSQDRNDKGFPLYPCKANLSPNRYGLITARSFERVRVAASPIARAAK